jgi:hypothetical protein
MAIATKADAARTAASEIAVALVAFMLISLTFCAIIA